MHLVSLAAQDVRIRGRSFRFRKGETIHTENSYKYTIGQFQDLSRSANWVPAQVWTDPREFFSVHELRAL
jgi:uncharacterized SAM-dependent methyltransferase